jgi:hypothetical protein
MKTRTRIPLSEIAKDSIRTYPEAYDLMTKLACRGIYLQLRENGELFYAETKGIDITLDQYREFKEQTPGLTAICEAAGLRRPPIGGAA